MKEIVFLSLLCAAFIFSSCKKDKEDPDPDKTSMVTKKWKGVGYYVNGSLSNSMGDTLEIKSDGSVLSYKKPIYSFTGTWHFTNSEQTKIQWTLNSNTSDYDIITLDDNSFVITNYPGVSEYRYVKIP